MRLIDADDLATAFPNGEMVATESVKATIHHMPTIEPPQWIPCSERVPGDRTLALITDSDGDVFVAGYDIWLGRWTTDGVIAWMPLPESYKEDRT